MTAVARVLPRDWDGHRLLRFLTGLALLALAFATHLLPAPAAAAPAAPASAPAAVAEVTRAERPVAEAVATEPLVPPAPVLLLLVLMAASVVVLTGVATRTPAVRGPPLS
ncbi:hypothetical protein [Actinoplanes sp. M2I2]|uniref:hypothetical protein n=1 Tax=Actinoplanes sp. M2I2 TaxID=1734444 RepID=UPI0020207DA2|nr:hypothetical protein [Actinoplanes sp. M2I2]